MMRLISYFISTALAVSLALASTAPLSAQTAPTTEASETSPQEASENAPESTVEAIEAAVGTDNTIATEIAPEEATEDSTDPATTPATEQENTMADTPSTDSTDTSAPTASADYMGNPEYMLNLDLSTGGRVVVQLYPDVAPRHVERIKLLARQGFYDKIKFHRVIEGFMAQTGDPTATGTGGSSLPNIKAEFNDRPHLRGTLSMARAEDEDSANSQFFIMFQPRFSLDNRYTVFGRVVSGMEYIDAINRGEPPTVMSEIVQMSIVADNKPAPPMSQLGGENDSEEELPSIEELNAPNR